MNQRNSETTGVLVGVVITALAGVSLLVLLLAGALALEIDMMKVGYGLMLLALFFTITGGVVTGVYARRAARLKRILAGDGRLAHWTYPARRFEQQQEKIYRREVSDKGGLFVITTLLLVIIGGVVFVPSYINGDIRNPWVFLAYLGIIPLIAFFAFALPWLNYRARHGRPAEAIIAREGLVLFGDFHPFKGMLQSLVGVELQEGPPAEIVFSLRFLSRVGWFSYTVYQVSVPVPEGELAAARRLVDQLEGDSPHAR
jgi:hypothetical protein